MRNIGTVIKSFPTNLRFLTIIIVVMIGLWLFITPFYEWVLDTFEFSPFVSVIIGAFIVWVGVRHWKLHPW